MVANGRIEELIRENKAEYIPDAIGEGSFFDMQTLTAALIELVVDGDVERGDRGRRRAEPARLHDCARAGAEGSGRRARRGGDGPQSKETDEPEAPPVVLASEELRLI